MKRIVIFVLVTLIGLFAFAQQKAPQTKGATPKQTESKVTDYKDTLVVLRLIMAKLFLSFSLIRLQIMSKILLNFQKAGFIMERNFTG